VGYDAGGQGPDEGEGMDPLERKYLEASVAEHLNKMVDEMDISPKLAFHLMKLEARIKRLEEEFGIEDSIGKGVYI
jgi:hypothetical protein